MQDGIKRMILEASCGLNPDERWFGQKPKHIHVIDCLQDNIMNDVQAAMETKADSH